MQRRVCPIVTLRHTLGHDPKLGVADTTLRARGDRAPTGRCERLDLTELSCQLYQSYYFSLSKPETEVVPI
jgi:hypothetical protein